MHFLLLPTGLEGSIAGTGARKESRDSRARVKDAAKGKAG